MKGKIAIFLAAALCVGGVTFAKLPAEEIALGGLTPDVTEEDVINIYGEPDEKTAVKYDGFAWNAYVQQFKYGGTVNLNFISRSADGPFYATLVSTSANNGFNTPRGIHVGSTQSEVIQTYGRPDLTTGNGKYLWYKCIGKGYDLVFYVEGNIVKTISVGYNA